MRMLVLTLTCLLLAACGKQEPKSGTTAESHAPRTVAEQEKEIAEKLSKQKATVDAEFARQSQRQDRERMAAPFLALMDRFDSIRASMSQSSRPETDNELNAGLEKIRADANELPVDSCMISARSTLFSAIDKTKALFSISKDNPTLLQDKVNEAFAEQKKAREQFDACLIVN